MDEIKKQLVETIADFIAKVAIYLPRDVEARIHELAAQEDEPMAKEMYACVLRNLELAKKTHRPLCQDTGLLQFFIDVGTRFPYIDILKDCIVEATAKATLETPLRPNVVEPLGEHNTGNNVGYDAPTIEWNLIPHSDSCKISLYMSGGGCSLPGRSKVLMPLQGVQGIKDYVSKTVLDWGVNACPPLLIGIGLGTCSATAALLSKKALLRPVGSHAENPKVAALEKEIQEELDAMGIAPLGFGGKHSVLGVNIEAAGHHPATLGVGITTGCWATRRGELILDKELHSQIPTHDTGDEQ